MKDRLKIKHHFYNHCAYLELNVLLTPWQSSQDFLEIYTINKANEKKIIILHYFSFFKMWNNATFCSAILPG